MTLFPGCHVSTHTARPQPVSAGGERAEGERAADKRASPLVSRPLTLRALDRTPRPWLEPGALYDRISLAHVTCQDHVVVHERSSWRGSRVWLIDVRTDIRYRLPERLYSTSLEHCDERGMILSGESALKRIVARFDFARKSWQIPDIELPPHEDFDTGLWRREFFDVTHITPVRTEDDGASDSFILAGRRKTLIYEDPIRINAVGHINGHEFGVGLWSPGEEEGDEVAMNKIDAPWDEMTGARVEGNRLVVTFSKLGPTSSTPSRHGTCCGPYSTYTSYALEGSNLHEITHDAIHASTPDHDTFEDFDDLDAARLIAPTTASEIETTWTDKTWQKVFVDTRSGKTWLAEADKALSSAWGQRASKSVYARSRTHQGAAHLDVYLLDFDAGEQRFIDTYEDCPGRLLATNIDAGVVALRCEKGSELEHIWSEVIDLDNHTRWRGDATQRAERVLHDGRVILSDAPYRTMLWVLRP